MNEFSDLAIELFGLKSLFVLARPSIPEELPSFDVQDSPEEANFKLEAAQDEWDDELNKACSELALILKRSGYYHALASGCGDSEKYYSIISERIAASEVEVMKLYFLEGCEFSSDGFDVGGFRVVCLSADKLQGLGAPAEVCKDFFPNEQIESKALSRRWFLQTESTVPTRLESAVMWDGEVWGAEEVQPAPAHQRKLELGLLDAALLLSLYSARYFGISKLLICEPGWRLVSWPFPLPRPDEKSQSYLVSSEKQSGFERYLTLGNIGLRNARNANESKKGNPIKIACRRYLQASFARGDVFTDWEAGGLVAEPTEIYVLAERERADIFEDALLHYVFALEALFIGDDKEAIGEKVALSAALLVGREDNEKACVRSSMKEAYKYRSGLAHGKEVGIERISKSLTKLRNICQRTLLILLSIYFEDRAFELKKLPELPISNELQGRVELARKHIFPLIADDSPMSDE